MIPIDTKKEFVSKNYLFLYTRMLETDALSDSKLLYRLTVFLDLIQYIDTMLLRT